MKLVGNIRQLKQHRDSGNREIELHLDNIEYITHRKDGKYYQPFDFVDELDSPLVITGDCLALADSRHVTDGENTFRVFDKTGEDYVLNEHKQLSLTLAYDFDTDTTILATATYTVTLPNEEFKRLKSERSKARKKNKGRKNR
ncbi:hypothetical protein [Pontibacter russatus]|uniref:hypothetical protein n=1 Tax=Pontibacter russatus TaxID=2694929 RepID=UPI00137B8709|nr:hypothetical protein [Pontibacter russatus]